MTIARLNGTVHSVDPGMGLVTLQADQSDAQALMNMGQPEVAVEIRHRPGPMRPTSLSASAAHKFELCEAGYRADYIDRVPEMGGSAGNLGSAVHEALEFWITSGQYLAFQAATWEARNKAMAVIWEMAYWNWFADQSRYAEGFEMLLNWIQRTEWYGREVLETEVKKSFPLPSEHGDIPFNYILDRKDRLSDSGIIEVVDYKTVAQPIQPEELKLRIQPRAYALAMFIEHKDEGVEQVKVTYDLLRYDTVSAYFNREDATATYHYLLALIKRIHASDGTKETLNPECRFCSRKTTCGTLRRYAESHGPLTMPTLEEVSERLLILQNAKGGLDAAITELQDQAVLLAEDGGVREWKNDTVTGKVTAKGRRGVESDLIARIVGPEIMSRYGTLNVGIVERILQEETSLTDNQKSQIKGHIKKTWGKLYVTVKPTSVFEEE